MFVKLSVLFLIAQKIISGSSIEDEWRLYESQFKHHTREEIFIENATTDQYFKSNFTVQTWKTLSVDTICYTGGISNNKLLVILFSTPSNTGSGIAFVEKVFDLQIALSDIEFFHERKNGNQTIFVVVYSPARKEFIWYSVIGYSLNKIRTWSMENPIKHFHIFKMGGNNFFLASSTNDKGINSADIYGFNLATLDRWLYQSIQLPDVSPSSCLSATDTDFYLSITQPTINKLLIYQYFEKHFILFDKLLSLQLDQVVCFENGFKSFIAINGLDADIYEFTTEGLSKMKIVNSNLEGVQFWLPIPVNIYRDETILMFQRKLHHDTHFSFDIDVVSYNGKIFEEHIDVPCSLFGEQQNGLRCLTEYNPNTGMLGTSYIRVGNNLALIVPKFGTTSIIFNLKIGLRKVEHPAKKDLESFLVLKDQLQAMIEEDNERLSQLSEKQKTLPQLDISEKTPVLKTAESSARSNSNNDTKSKFPKLKDDVIDVINEVEELNLKVKDMALRGKEGKYGTIIFNGPVEIQKDLGTHAFTTKDEDIIDLLNDFVRRDQLGSISAQKVFSDLTVDEVTFENVNGIPSNEFVLNNDGEVEIHSDINFDKHVDVKDAFLTTGVINDIHIGKWISVDNLVKGIKGPISFEQLEARSDFSTELLNNQTLDNMTNPSHPFSVTIDNLEKLVIPGSVTVKKLNGEDFEGFLRKLCLNNVKCHIPSLKMEGAMMIEENAYIQHLNGLKFPEDYIGSEPNETLIITGFKEFKNILRGYVVTSNKTVNNVDLSKIVNLSGEQNITGTITFNNLEVVSGLNVDGKVKGQEIEHFIPNIGLKETTNIKSSVEFRNLEILGDLIIKRNFNNTGFNEYLDNIILKNENATVTGKKTFPKGFTNTRNLYINSSLINNISLNSIITKDTSQDLKVDTILGDVEFRHLYVKGLVDGQNITELNKTLAKLAGNRTVESELVFMEDVFAKTLILDQLTAQNNINTARGDTEVNFDELELIENVIVEGNIIGDIDKFDLKEYLQYVGDQSISEPYFIERLTTNGLNVKHLNNIPFDNMFSLEKFRKNIRDILMYRNATVETMSVEENLNIKDVNNIDFRNILGDHAWMKLHRNLSRLIIDGDVYFESLEIQNLANANFDEFFSNLIFKNETDVEIENLVVFQNGIHVKKLLETTTLNNVALENILRKDGNQSIVGSVNIEGDVTIADDVTVKEMINNVEVAYMLDNFDIGEESLKFKGEVMFQRMSYIRNLTINGFINGIDFKNVKNKFVYTNRDVHLEKNILFNETVTIHGNMGISGDINGIVLSEFVSRLVWLTQDADIEGPIKFTHSAECYKSMNVENGMNTKLLFGQSLENHLNQGVFVNKGFLQGPFVFGNVSIHEDLKTKFINDMDMEGIIPLKTSQRINELNIGEITVAHDFDVGNTVNGVNLVVERNKTLLSNVEQHLPIEVIFQNNVLVEDNLNTPAINGKPASKIVTTNTDQILTAPYNFNSKCFAEGHLRVNGLINGINLTSWKNSTVNTEKPQHIKNRWAVMENLNLVGPVNGEGMMSDMNITKLVKDVQRRESYLYGMEKGITDDFNNLCADVTYIYNNSRNQIYKFKYFEEFQTVSLPNNVNYVKYFEYRGRHHMIVNEDKSCFSDLLMLNDKGFSKVNTFHTGGISQIVAVRGKKELFLVSRGLDVDNLPCKVRFSAVVWKWDREGNMKILASIASQEILQESQVPLTFYGLKHGVVTEFKIDPTKEITIQEYRKWDIKEDNASFIPRGLKTGLTLSTGKHSIFLQRNDPVVDEEYGINTKAIIPSNFTKKWNSVIPGQNGGDTTVVNVGVKGNTQTLLAVARHKASQVQHRLDIVEIYSDPFKGELFDKILAYKPTALTSIEFGNGETLLAFLEDRKALQIYEYKGIEGFQHRSSIKIQANQMFLMELPTENQSQPIKVLGLLHNNKITLLEAIMTGSKIKDDLQCTTIV